MALIICPECGRDVSDKAETCPHCGVSIQEELKNYENAVKPWEEHTVCPECGKYNKPEDYTCKYCGHSYTVGEHKVVTGGNHTNTKERKKMPDLLKVLILFVAVIGVLLLISGALDSIVQIDTSDMEKAGEELQESLDALSKSNDDIEDFLQQENDFDRIVDDYFELANRDYSDLTLEEKKKLKKYANYILDYLGEGSQLYDYIDPKTGKYNN